MSEQNAQHTYKVQVETDLSTGQVISESWFNEEGEMHHPSGKPAFTQFYSNGDVWREEYYVNGALHRDGDHPASLSYESREHPEVATRVFWYKDGVQFRAPELPSSVCYDPETGFPVYEEVTDSSGGFVWQREREYGTGRIIGLQEEPQVVAKPPTLGV